MKPCPHCGIPDQSRWQVACAWMTPGTTRPCAVEFQMEEERKRERRGNVELGSVGLVLLAFVLVCVAAYFITR